MKTIPITVLVHDSPTARAYLTALAHENMRPERLILMIPENHPGTGKPIGRWLPTRFRRSLAEKAQNLSMFHWPRTLRATNKDLTDRMISGISEALDFPAELLDSLDGHDPLEEFTDNIQRVMISGLGDQRLADLLAQVSPSTVLFTGGGIVPRSILDISNLRLLHIHPGLLPHVRGSDGLLWSYLVHGQPGASCFYMAPGIDTGDVIAAENYKAAIFPIPQKDRPDNQTLYRLIFSIFDPVLRARMLLTALSLNDDPATLPTDPQDCTAGVTYHFMSPEVRHASLLRVFPES